MCIFYVQCIWLVELVEGGGELRSIIMWGDGGGGEVPYSRVGGY